MIVKAAAKINLMLDVVGKLPNGYHSLFMIMQSVSCYDTVRVDRTGENGIKIISSDERVPKDEKNIAYKAAEAFFDYAGISDRGIEIEIGKKIPMAAGLAGGSADGAGVLYILNRLYKTGFDEFTLCSIGEKVGADVPFSLTGGTSLCVDTGGVIAPLPAIPTVLLFCVSPIWRFYRECIQTDRRGAAYTSCRPHRHAVRDENPRYRTYVRKNEQCFRAGDRGTETPVYQNRPMKRMRC